MKLKSDREPEELGERDGEGDERGGEQGGREADPPTPRLLFLPKIRLSDLS